MPPTTSTNGLTEQQAPLSSLNGVVAENNINTSTVQRLESNLGLQSYVRPVDQLSSQGNSNATLDAGHTSALALLKSRGNQQKIVPAQDNPFTYVQSPQEFQDFSPQLEPVSNYLGGPVVPQIDPGQYPFQYQNSTLPQGFAPYPSSDVNNLINQGAFTSPTGNQAGGINLSKQIADPASYANLNTPPLQQINQIPLPSNAANNIVATNQQLNKIAPQQTAEQKPNTPEIVKLKSQTEVKQQENKSDEIEPPIKKIFKLFKNKAFDRQLQMTQKTLDQIRLNRSQNQDKSL